MIILVLSNLKNLFLILALTLILVSCQEEAKIKSSIAVSDFNLKTDIYDFKKKMNESDTLIIWFDHSVCMFEGYERIQIIKFLDSIIVKSELKEELFHKETDWKPIYEKIISIEDTIWKFEKFLEINSFRLDSEENEFGRLQISHRKNKLNYFTTDLLDLNRFLKDYYQTMQVLYPENITSIYGFLDLE